MTIRSSIRVSLFAALVLSVLTGVWPEGGLAQGDPAQELADRYAPVAVLRSSAVIGISPVIEFGAPMTVALFAPLLAVVIRSRSMRGGVPSPWITASPVSFAT